MLLIRSQITDFLMYLIMAVIGILFAPAAIWSREGAYWVIKTYCATIFWLLRTLCNLKVEFRGEVPQGDVLICSKHMSFLDIMMLAYILPRPKFIMKKQLKWAPIIGIYGLRIGSTPVARGKKGAAIQEMVDDIEGKSSSGGQLIIFPQGTRVLPGANNPYRVGAGVIYSKMGQTCVPVATNAGVFWARRSPYRYPGTAVIEFLDPIPKGMEVRPFIEKLEEVIEENSNRLMLEAGYKFDKD